MNGIYGTSVSVNFDYEDIDIFYSYSETRNADDIESAEFVKIPSSLLSRTTYTNEAGIDERHDNILEGMGRLKLPLEYFNRKGFYTIYIKNREFPCVIADVGTLTAFNDINGIVLDTTAINNDRLRNKALTNNALVGWRIIYFDTNGYRQDMYRLVTSNARVEPVVENATNSASKAITYRYNDNSNLVFLTLTPSTAPSFRPSMKPSVGSVAQKISLVPTTIEPVMIDLELTSTDTDTITTLLNGSTLRTLDNGLVTIFNDDGEIFAQNQHYSLKEPDTGNPIYEVRLKKDDIDYSQTLEGKV